jgi:hypothetical protein
LAAGGLAGVPSTSTAATDNLSLFLDTPLDLVPTPEAELRAAIREAYEGRMAQSSPLAATSSERNDGAAIAPRPDVAAELAALADRDLLTAGGKAPVARLVDALLSDVSVKGASDLHRHRYPSPNPRLVRYRIDGVLRDICSPDPTLHNPPPRQPHLPPRADGRTKARRHRSTRATKLPPSSPTTTARRPPSPAPLHLGHPYDKRDRPSAFDPLRIIQMMRRAIHLFATIVPAGRGGVALVQMYRGQATVVIGGRAFRPRGGRRPGW